jgi:hypothetical protein
MSEDIQGGTSRRDVLKRGALVGGALIWTAPAVQTLASPAFAAVGSDVPGDCIFQSGLCAPNDTGCTPTCFTVNPRSAECCALADQIDQISNGIDRGNAILAFFRGACGDIAVAIDCP